MRSGRGAGSTQGCATPRRAFQGPGGTYWAPPLLPVRDADPETYLRDLPDELGVHCVVLVQAGASALGWWEQGELVRHKVITKYVVRGRGKAQGTHLNQKGKSRYGSRLRLQNAKAQLVETNERLIEWWDEFGPPDVTFCSCPVRLLADVFGTSPQPPFARDEAIKIPLDVRAPRLAEVERVYRAMSRGVVEMDAAPE